MQLSSYTKDQYKKEKPTMPPIAMESKNPLAFCWIGRFEYHKTQIKHYKFTT